jgi:membrane protease YdiL (CAAX protease family)
VRNVAYLAGIVLTVAVAAHFAFDVSRAGTPSFFIIMAVPTVILALLGILRAKDDGVLRHWIGVRSGDFTRGFAAAAVLFGGAFAFTKFVAPPDSIYASWLARLYLQLGDPAMLRKHIGMIVLAIVVLAIAEEIVWRGLVISLLEEKIGSRRAWVWAAVLYALAHAPTIWALRDPRRRCQPRHRHRRARVRPGLGWNGSKVRAALARGLRPRALRLGCCHDVQTVGPERLTSLLWSWPVALLFAAANVGCRGASAPASAPVVQPHGRHIQIVHAMKTAERHALVERLRERNPTPLGHGWTVNEDALTASLTVVDPFSRFLRRARREGSLRPPHEGAPIDEGAAATSARDFVKRNADILGLPRHVVPGLAERLRRVEASDHASPRATWLVRLEAPFASKGYEGFKEVDNVADVEVLVDDDGEVSSFVNLSRIHPHLTIDTKPLLGQDDPRVLANLVGRRLFALEGATIPGQLDLGGVRALRRIQLGEVRPEDVTHMQLVIHVATGPQLAWLTYRLGWFVEVARAMPVAPGDPPQFFFFRYVVDADSGDVLEDASAPVAAPITVPDP